MPHKVFSPDAIGRFVSRPNRFIAIVDVEGQQHKAHCANPGRMRELLLPGRRVFLEKSNSLSRTTAYTLAAVEYGSRTIPLVSSRANALIGETVIPEMYQGMEAFPEQTLGRSRIDWLCTSKNREVWIEVKSCTLVERNRAMFPDAPSSRAVKHLGELSELTDHRSGSVIFAVMNPDAAVFSPNPHTDPELTLAMAESMRKGTQFTAVSFTTDTQGYALIENSSLPMDMTAADLVHMDSGAVLSFFSPENTGEPWLLDISIINRAFGRALHRKKTARSTGTERKPLLVYPIRGPKHVFGSMEKELLGLASSLTSDNAIMFNSNPLEEPRVLELLLDYRHERVFRT